MARSRRRQRNYAVEYKRRIDRGRAAGKSKQAARGHATPAGVTEYQRRAQRTQAEFGLSPRGLTELRRAAVAHVITELDRVGTKGRVNEEQVIKGMRLLHRQSLETVLHAEGVGMKIVAGLTVEQLIDHEWFEDEDTEEWVSNPLWYK